MTFRQMRWMIDYIIERTHWTSVEQRLALELVRDAGIQFNPNFSIDKFNNYVDLARDRRGQISAT